MENDPKIIALFDPFTGGHHEMYATLYSNVLLELGYDVWMFFPKTDIFDELKNKYGNRLKLYSISIETKNSDNKYLSLFLSIFRTIKLWRRTKHEIMLVSKADNMEPNLVFFLWLDSYLHPQMRSWMIDSFFKYKWSGIYFHPRFLRIPVKKFIFKNDYLLRSKYCQFVSVLDENVSTKLQKSVHKEVLVLPDATDKEYTESTLTKEIISKARGRKIIGLLGSLAKRKGILTLMEVLKETDSNKYFFIIAGELSKATFSDQEYVTIINLTKNPPENCFIKTERIETESEFNELINACDIVHVVYENFPHSSGIMTKAAIFNKFLITSDKYLMAERTKKYDLGIAISADSSIELGKAIASLSQGEDLRGKKIVPKFQEYVSDHSPERLKEQCKHF